MTDILSPADALSAASIHRRTPSARQAASTVRSGEPAPSADPHLQTACAEMESLFLYYLLQKMRSTVEKSDLFGTGRSEELYTSMLDSEVAKNIAAEGGIGLSGVLLRQFLQSGAVRGTDP